MKDINITETLVRVPVIIEVDGVKYPRTQHNIEVVDEYWDTGDEDVLDKLSNVSLIF